MAIGAIDQRTYAKATLDAANNLQKLTPEDRQKLGKPISREQFDKTLKQQSQIANEAAALPRVVSSLRRKPINERSPLAETMNTAFLQYAMDSAGKTRASYFKTESLMPAVFLRRLTQPRDLAPKT